MPATTVVSESRTHTIELAVTDAPPLKVEYVYYEVTGLRLTYVDDELTDLVVIGVAEDTGETERLSTRMSAYEMVQPWIRDEVEKHRPSRRPNGLREAADKLTIREATPLWDAVNTVLLKYGFYNPASSVPYTEEVFGLFRTHLCDVAAEPAQP